MLPMGAGSQAVSRMQSTADGVLEQSVHSFSVHIIARSPPNVQKTAVNNSMLLYSSNLYLIRVSRAGCTRRRRQQDLSISSRLDDHPSGLLRAGLCGAFRGLGPVVSRRSGGVRAHAHSRQGIGATGVASGQENRGPAHAVHGHVSRSNRETEHGAGCKFGGVQLSVGPSVPSSMWYFVE